MHGIFGSIFFVKWYPTGAQIFFGSVGIRESVPCNFCICIIHYIGVLRFESSIDSFWVVGQLHGIFWVDFSWNDLRPETQIFFSDQSGSENPRIRAVQFLHMYYTIYWSITLLFTHRIVLGWWTIARHLYWFRYVVWVEIV